MRTLLSLFLAVTTSLTALLLAGGGVADAAFHCMRIHAVMGGYNGNNNIQYVELRMTTSFQGLVGNHVLQFFDQSGTLKATFTFPMGTSMSNAVTGDSILIATSEFNSNVTGGAADFMFSGANAVGANGGDPLHPVQVPGGSVLWAPGGSTCGTNLGMPSDAVAYGGATAIYGTAAVALPNPGTLRALRLSNLNNPPSNNSTEYALQNVATSTFSVTSGNLPTDFTTPRNNGRVVLKLPAPPSVGGVAEDPGQLSSPVGTAATDSASWGAYAIAGGVAGALVAGGAGWYVYRRRSP